MEGGLADSFLTLVFRMSVLKILLLSLQKKEAMKENKTGIYSSASLEFITVANEYCAFLELQKEYTPKDFVDKCTKLLPLLYLKTSLLPRFEPILEEPAEKFVTEYDYNHLNNNIAEKLGEHNDFLEVFHEDMQYSDTPILAYISESLCDIYQDLKDTLQNFELAAEEAMNDAMYECQSNFENIWGQTLVNVLRPLHQLKYSSIFDEE